MLSNQIYVYQDNNNHILRIKVKPYLSSETYRLAQLKLVEVFKFSRQADQQNAMKSLRELFGRTTANIKPTIDSCDKIDEICNPLGSYIKDEQKLRDKAVISVYKPPKVVVDTPHSAINLRTQSTYHPIYIHRVMRFKRRMDYLIDSMTEEQQKANADISLWLAPKPLSHTKPKVGSPIRSKVIYTIYFDSREKHLELIKRINETQLWDSARNVAYNKSSIEVIKKLTEEIKGLPEPEMVVDDLIA